MINPQIDNKILKLTNRLWLFTLMVFSVSCSVISDNSNILSSELESAAQELKSQKVGSEVTINFEPNDDEAPFTILILSEKGVTFDALIERGLDSLLVADLFPRLSHIDLKNSATCVIYQNQEISYTTYYRRFVDVKTTQIISGKGATDIVVKKIGVGPGNITEEVILIELQ
jgi:hypothetical protein